LVDRAITKEDWKFIRYFSPEENWGDPYRMSLYLVKQLDELRDFIGYPIYILYGSQGKHSKKSYHYTDPCKAVDCYCKDLSLLDFYFAAERFNFGGIGIYPYWKPYPGLHLDIRGADQEFFAGARWGRIRIKKGKIEIKKYVALDRDFVYNHIFKRGL